MGILKYGLRYVVWLRKNFRRLVNLISAHGFVAALPEDLCSGPKPVKLFGRFSVPRNLLIVVVWVLLLLVMFTVGIVVWVKISGESTIDASSGDCKCLYGFCAPDDAFRCKSCSQGFTLSVEGSCLPSTCNCENGVCARGSSSSCVACAEAFQLKDGKCVRSKCECPNGECSLSSSYCTSCNPGFELRSTGKAAVGANRNDYMFTTPICIAESLVRSVSRDDGGFQIL